MSSKSKKDVRSTATSQLALTNSPERLYAKSREGAAVKASLCIAALNALHSLHMLLHSQRPDLPRTPRNRVKERLRKVPWCSSVDCARGSCITAWSISLFPGCHPRAELRIRQGIRCVHPEITQSTRCLQVQPNVSKLAVHAKVPGTAMKEARCHVLSGVSGLHLQN